ncbi:MAG: WecB/TagA/CpsF family glycosyltransferase [Cyanobacteria bacterium J06582_2]
MIPTQNLLDIPVTCLPFEEQIMLMLRWAKTRSSKAVCLANVHMLIEAYRNPNFAGVLRQANLVTPDGKPLVLMLQKLGVKHQNQVAGMDVFLNLCDLAEQTGVKVYFLGSTQKVLDKIKRKLDREYPVLQVAGMKAIAKIETEDVTKSYDLELVDEINQSGAGIVFVCLGCPKQEIWISHHLGVINSVMVGVGAVFSMYAGINPRAPRWIQQAGMEWLYRLLQEPRRLWGRYSSTIPPFLYLASKELITPYKKKLSQARWRKTKRNITINLEAIESPYEQLGEILVRQNVIDQNDLEGALAQQRSGLKQKLGEILVRQNLMSRSQLKFYLKNQNIKFGEFLVDKKVLNRRSLKNILALKDDTDKKIGEIISEQNILTEEKLKELFVEYYTRKKGLFLTDSQNENNNDLSLWVENLLNHKSGPDSVLYS